MKIINAVIAGGDGIYKKLLSASMDTCFNKEYEEIKTFFIFGRKNGSQYSSEYLLEGNNFYYNKEESYELILEKTVSFFEFCLLNLDFDYIFRTHIGSYVDLPLMKKHFESLNLDAENVYCAYPGVYRGQLYGSGAGFFISKDLVELIVKNKEKLKDGIDDVEIGKLLITDNKKELDTRIHRKVLSLDEIEQNNHLIDDVCYHYYIKKPKDPQVFYLIQKIKENK